MHNEYRNKQKKIIAATNVQSINEVIVQRILPLLLWSNLFFCRRGSVSSTCIPAVYVLHKHLCTFVVHFCINMLCTACIRLFFIFWTTKIIKPIIIFVLVSFQCHRQICVWLKIEWIVSMNTMNGGKMTGISFHRHPECNRFSFAWLAHHSQFPL